VLLFHLKGFEVKKVRKEKGFEVQSDYLKVYRTQHTCEILHPLEQLGDLLLSSS
jgi:hypothetical protein